MVQLKLMEKHSNLLKNFTPFSHSNSYSRQKKKLNHFFDTFKKEIIVHKEAKRVVAQINMGFLYGYGDVSNQTNYTHQTHSQTFSAIVWYPKKGSGGFEIGGEIRAFIPEGEILIKVGEEAKTYLTSGMSVEKIDILKDKKPIGKNV